MGRGPTAGRGIRFHKIRVPRRNAVHSMPNRNAIPIQVPTRVPMRVPIQLAIREPMRRADPNRRPNPSRRTSHHARRRRESAKGWQRSA